MSTNKTQFSQTWVLALVLLFALSSTALAGGTVDLTAVATDFLGSLKAAVTIFGCVVFAAGIVAAAAAREFGGVAATLLSFGSVIALVGQIDTVFGLIGVSGGVLL